MLHRSSDTRPSGCTGDFRILLITAAHALTLASLPMHRKDPFDRLIISQAISEHIPVVSTDSVYGLYDLKRIC
ncbi:MAG: hypothetical protein RLZZ232_3104 [Planctomycetota bacterium]|jgi:PIN domain nuclease of toxin-antitoxin system